MSYAEFALYPWLVIPGNIARTIANVDARHGAVVAAVLRYFVDFMGHRHRFGTVRFCRRPSTGPALLAAWFRPAYATVAIVAVINLATSIAC